MLVGLGFLAAVSNLFGTTFLWKTIFPQTRERGGGLGMIQVHCIYCVLYFYYHYISFPFLGRTSIHSEMLILFRAKFRRCYGFTSLGSGWLLALRFKSKGFPVFFLSFYFSFLLRYNTSTAGARIFGVPFRNLQHIPPACDIFPRNMQNILGPSGPSS